jgi:dTDP-4-amino-4,6-dideoxygalactose transaminase
MQIPFHKTAVPKSLDQILTDSIKEGWLTTGPIVKKFEDFICDYTLAENTVAVNSCTAGLHLALAAKEFPIGSKFIAPTYTFVATVEVGVHLGMSPVLVDCDENFNIDLNQAYEHLKNDKDIRAIMPVHFAGKPVNMKEIIAIAEKFDLFIVEDAAHSFETVSNLSKVGNSNHVTSFSFYANKNITTAGEGGAITTNDSNLSEKIRKLSLHGMSKDGWKRFKFGNKWEYDVDSLGFKYNLTDFAASYGLWQLKFLNDWHIKRKDIFNFYQNKFKNINGLVLPQDVTLEERHSYHLYVIKLIPEYWNITRNEIIIKLNEKGVGTSVHYKPVHLHTYYSNNFNMNQNDFPVSNDFYENVISLPIYPLLDKKSIDHIAEVIIWLWGKFQR